MPELNEEFIWSLKFIASSGGVDALVKDFQTLAKSGDLAIQQFRSLSQVTGQKFDSTHLRELTTTLGKLSQTKVDFKLGGDLNRDLSLLKQIETLLARIQNTGKLKIPTALFSEIQSVLPTNALGRPLPPGTTLTTQETNTLKASLENFQRQLQAPTEEFGRLQTFVREFEQDLKISGARLKEQVASFAAKTGGTPETLNRAREAQIARTKIEIEAQRNRQIEAINRQFPAPRPLPEAPIPPVLELPTDRRLSVDERERILAGRKIGDVLALDQKRQEQFKKEQEAFEKQKAQIEKENLEAEAHRPTAVNAIRALQTQAAQELAQKTREINFEHERARAVSAQAVARAAKEQQIPIAALNVERAQRQFAERGDLPGLRNELLRQSQVKRGAEFEKEKERIFRTVPTGQQEEALSVAKVEKLVALKRDEEQIEQKILDLGEKRNRTFDQFLQSTRQEKEQTEAISRFLSTRQTQTLAELRIEKEKSAEAKRQLEYVQALDRHTRAPGLTGQQRRTLIAEDIQNLQVKAARDALIIDQEIDQEEKRRIGQIRQINDLLLQQNESIAKILSSLHLEANQIENIGRLSKSAAPLFGAGTVHGIEGRVQGQINLDQFRKELAQIQNERERIQALQQIREAPLTPAHKATASALAEQDFTLRGAAIEQQFLPAAARVRALEGEINRLSQQSVNIRRMSFDFATLSRNILFFAQSVNIPIAQGIENLDKLAIGWGAFNTIARQTPEELKATQETVLNLFSRVPVKNVDDLGLALYNIASSGFSGSDSLKLLDTSAKLATIGMTDTNSAAKFLTQTMQAFQISTSGSEETAKKLVSILNVSTGEFGQVGLAIAKASSAANLANQDLSRLGAVFATLTTAGGFTPRIAGTAATSLFRDLTQRRAQFENLFGFDAVDKNKGEIRGIDEILTRLAKLRSEGKLTVATLQEAFKNQLSVRAITILLNNLEKFKAALKETQHPAEDFEATFARATADVGHQMQTLQNRFTRVFVAAAVALEPTIRGLVRVSEVISNLILQNRGIATLVLNVGAIGASILGFGAFFAAIALRLRNLKNDLLALFLARDLASARAQAAQAGENLKLATGNDILLARIALLRELIPLEETRVGIATQAATATVAGGAGSAVTGVAANAAGGTAGGALAGTTAGASTGLGARFVAGRAAGLAIPGALAGTGEFALGAAGGLFTNLLGGLAAFVGFLTSPVGIVATLAGAGVIFKGFADQTQIAAKETRDGTEKEIATYLKLRDATSRNVSEQEAYEKALKRITELGPGVKAALDNLAANPLATATQARAAAQRQFESASFLGINLRSLNHFWERDVEQFRSFGRNAPGSERLKEGEHALTIQNNLIREAIAEDNLPRLNALYAQTDKALEQIHRRLLKLKEDPAIFQQLEEDAQKLARSRVTQELEFQANFPRRGETHTDPTSRRFAALLDPHERQILRLQFEEKFAPGIKQLLDLLSENGQAVIQAQVNLDDPNDVIRFLKEFQKQHILPTIRVEDLQKPGVSGNTLGIDPKTGRRFTVNAQNQAVDFSTGKVEPGVNLQSLFFSRITDIQKALTKPNLLQGAVIENHRYEIEQRRLIEEARLRLETQRMISGIPEGLIRQIRTILSSLTVERFKLLGVPEKGISSETNIRRLQDLQNIAENTKITPDQQKREERLVNRRANLQQEADLLQYYNEQKEALLRIQESLKEHLKLKFEITKQLIAQNDEVKAQIAGIQAVGTQERIYAATLAHKAAIQKIEEEDQKRRLEIFVAREKGAYDPLNLLVQQVKQLTSGIIDATKELTQFGQVALHIQAQIKPGVSRPGTPPDSLGVPTRTKTNASAYFQDLARRATTGTRITPETILALWQQESSLNPQAVSPKGARGLGQFMPKTGAYYGLKTESDFFDPEKNGRASARYLEHLLEITGSLRLAFAAYNAGLPAVQKAGGVPPFKETQKYVADMEARLGKGVRVSEIPKEKGVNVANLTPDAKIELNRLNHSMNQLGISFRISSAFSKRPQRSEHNFGRAADIIAQGNQQGIAEYLRKLGFAASFEFKNQKNANGSTATADHIHVNLSRKTIPQEVMETNPALAKSLTTNLSREDPSSIQFLSKYIDPAILNIFAPFDKDTLAKTLARDASLKSNLIQLEGLKFLQTLRQIQKEGREDIFRINQEAKQSEIDLLLAPFQSDQEAFKTRSQEINLKLAKDLERFDHERNELITRRRTALTHTLKFPGDIRFTENGKPISNSQGQPLYISPVEDIKNQREQETLRKARQGRVLAAAKEQIQKDLEQRAFQIETNRLLLDAQRTLDQIQINTIKRSGNFHRANREEILADGRAQQAFLEQEAAQAATVFFTRSQTQGLAQLAQVAAKQALLAQEQQNRLDQENLKHNQELAGVLQAQAETRSKQIEVERLQAGLRAPIAPRQERGFAAAQAEVELTRLSAQRIALNAELDTQISDPRRAEIDALLATNEQERQRIELERQSFQINSRREEALNRLNNALRAGVISEREALTQQILHQDLLKKTGETTQQEFEREQGYIDTLRSKYIDHFHALADLYNLDTKERRQQLEIQRSFFSPLSDEAEKLGIEIQKLDREDFQRIRHGLQDTVFGGIRDLAINPAQFNVSKFISQIGATIRSAAVEQLISRTLEPNLKNFFDQAAQGISGKAPLSLEKLTTEETGAGEFITAAQQQLIAAQSLVRASALLESSLLDQVGAGGLSFNAPFRDNSAPGVKVDFQGGAEKFKTIPGLSAAVLGAFATKQSANNVPANLSPLPDGFQNDFSQAYKLFIESQKPKAPSALKRDLGYALAGFSAVQAGVEAGPVGGALSGALTGFGVAGPIGAVAGGLLGAIGGLFHKKKKQPLPFPALPNISDVLFASQKFSQGQLEGGRQGLPIGMHVDQSDKRSQTTNINIQIGTLVTPNTDKFSKDLGRRVAVEFGSGR